MKFVTRLRDIFSFPVLQRELSQQAAKKRNYVARVLYAAIAFMLGAFVLIDLLASGLDRIPFSSLGRGREVFDRLLYTQFVFVYLFLPAYCSGLITLEKERGTLQLLLLSKLSPTAIIVEKLCSRLIPFLAIVVMVAPLMGVAYALGGIEQQFVWNAVFLLLLAAVQTAAVAVACSAWCKKSTHAFVATYAVGFIVFYLAPVIFLRFCGYSVGYTAGQPDTVQFYGYRFDPDAVFRHCAALHYDRIGEHTTVRAAVRASLPVLFTTACFLLAARFYIIRRASAHRRSLLPRALSLVDNALNRISGGRLTNKYELPADAPVTWMETKRGILGNPRHQIYLVAFIEVCVVVWIGYLLGTSRTDFCPRELMDGMLLLFALVMLIICSRSVSIFSIEQSGETLPTLLATPLTNREIISQKYLGMRNLIAFLLIPCLTFVAAFGLHAFWAAESFEYRINYNRTAYSPFRHFDLGRYTIVMVASLVVYSQMIAWLGVNVGMLFKKRSVALFILLALLAGWFALPVATFPPLFEHFNINNRSPASTITFVSPAVVPGTSMFGTAIGGMPWRQAILSLLWHIACWDGLRRLAHRQFERHSGRKDNDANQLYPSLG